MPSMSGSDQAAMPSCGCACAPADPATPEELFAEAVRLAVEDVIEDAYRACWQEIGDRHPATDQRLLRTGAHRFLLRLREGLREPRGRRSA